MPKDKTNEQPPTPLHLTEDAVWQPLPDTIPVGFIDLSPKHCRWPVGQFLYCGCKPADGRPYCETHDRVAKHGAGALNVAA